MHFDVRTIGPKGTIETLRIEADSLEDARRRAQHDGRFVSEVRIVRTASVLPQRLGLGGGKPLGGAKKLSLVLFSQELLALINAGLGVVESLQALHEKESNPGIRECLHRLLESLSSGKRFSAALAEQPRLFPPLYVGIVQAAEGTSDLPRSLARYVDYQQRVDSVRNKVVSAAIYPCILMSVGGAVSFFLMMYVVPRFAEVYQGAGRQLPFASQLMLDFGQLVSAHTTLFLAAQCAFAFALVTLWRRLQRRGGVVLLLSRIPVLRERVRIYELARVYLTLGMLLEGGITILRALATVQPMASVNLRAALGAASASVDAGAPLSSAFEAAGLTTPISLRMLRVGERTGEMGPMLTQSAAFYDGEIDRWIDRFTRSLEPVLMAAIGLVVGAIVILLYMPIFDLAGDLS